MGKLFGTDGVRGIANKELTPELAFKIGRASAYILKSDTDKKPTFLIGTDTRISRDLLQSGLAAGICSVGANVKCIGIIPTPAVAYLTRKYKADAGCVISASHNSFEYNGIKIFNQDGLKLSDEIENRIENIILSERDEIKTYLNDEIGTISFENNAINDYVNFLKNTIDVDLAGMKILVDCSNGAAYEAAPRVLHEMEADIMTLFNRPDGININRNCGSTYINTLKARIKEGDFDCGLAFDGDADRLLMVDEKGNIIDGDQILTIISLFFKKENRLKNNTIVTTVMSNIGLDKMAEANDINVIKTKVGDRYVLEEMLKNEYIIGGEQSGHIILLEKNTTGDGLVTALQMLRIIKITGKKLSELASEIEIFPQVLENAKVDNLKKEFYNDNNKITAKIIELESEFKNEGRVLVRPSGTEPVIRVMIEGRDRKYIQKKAKELASLIENELN